MNIILIILIMNIINMLSYRSPEPDISCYIDLSHYFNLIEIPHKPSIDLLNIYLQFFIRSLFELFVVFPR